VLPRVVASEEVSNLQHKTKSAFCRASSVSRAFSQTSRFISRLRISDFACQAQSTNLDKSNYMPVSCVYSSSMSSRVPGLLDGLLLLALRRLIPGIVSNYQPCLCLTRHCLVSACPVVDKKIASTSTTARAKSRFRSPYCLGCTREGQELSFLAGAVSEVTPAGKQGACRR